MRCPKCQFDHELQTTECLKCGIVFSRYQAALDQAAKQVAGQGETAPTTELAPEPLLELEPAISRGEALRELKCRSVALPAALLLAWLAAGTGFRMLAGMLAMPLHESGHAITAWLTGRWAIPMLWVTPHGQDRSWFIVLLVTGAIGFVGYLAWQAERPGWLFAAAGVFVLQLIVLSQPAGALIIFFGDGGALVLATLLMAAFYAPRESALRKNWGLRWGLLAIGALAFLHVFLLWKGPLEDLPFGEIEGVNLSDPSLLTEMYGWSVLQMVDRYVRLGEGCLVFLLVLYVWGLVSAYREMPANPPEKQPVLAHR